MGRRETILKATEWVQIMYPASTGNIYHFLFSDLKPAARVHSVKLMDWIDSQQWLLQLEDESPHHFLSFFSSFFCFPPSVAPSFFFKTSSLLSTPTSTRTYRPSLQLSPSAVPSSQHLINICLGFRSLSACRHLQAHTCTFAQSRALTRTLREVDDRRNGTPTPPQSCFYVCK